MANNKLFENANFRNYVIGLASSNIGNVFYGFAVTWYLLSITHSAFHLSAFFLVGNIARTVVLSFSGNYIDNRNKISIMMRSDFARFVFLIPAVLVVRLSDSISLHVVSLYTVHILLNIADGFFDPASNAVIPSLVEKEELTQAWSLFSLVDSFQYAIAMLLIGVLYSVIGIFGILIVDGFTFLVSFYFNKKIKLDSVNTVTTHSTSKKLFKLINFRWILNEKYVFNVLLISSFYGFFIISLSQVGYRYIFNQGLSVAPEFFSIFAFSGIIGTTIISSIMMKTKKKFDFFILFRRTLIIVIFITTISFYSIFLVNERGVSLFFFIVVLCLYNFTRSVLMGRVGTIMNVKYSEMIPKERRGQFFAMNNFVREIVTGVSIILGGLLLDFSLNIYLLFVIMGTLLTLLLLLAINRKNKFGITMNDI